MSTYYKILGLDRMPCHGGTGQWPEPGQWREESGPLVLGQRGTLHLCRLQDLPCWVTCPGEVWEAEADGEFVTGNTIVSVLRARLTRRVGALTPAMLARWATKCAARANEAANGLDYHARLAITHAAQADYAARAADAVIEAGGADDPAAALAACTTAQCAANAADAAAMYFVNAAYRASGLVTGSIAADHANHIARAAVAAERRWQGERLLALVRGD